MITGSDAFVIPPLPGSAPHAWAATGGGAVSPHPRFPRPSLVSDPVPLVAGHTSGRCAYWLRPVMIVLAPSRLNPSARTIKVSMAAPAIRASVYSVLVVFLLVGLFIVGCFCLLVCSLSVFCRSVQASALGLSPFP